MAERDNPLANLAQKAFYFGMGLAALVADNAPKVAGGARDRLLELRKQVQALVDELVELGAMRAEEARVYKEEGEAASGPRKITIEDMGEAAAERSTAIELSEAARLRKQIAELQAELERFKREAGKA